ncbi:PP2C family protein-serine/threonine phosphatase [Streptomyces sp. NPDC002309]
MIRMRALGLPTVWGALAITYKLACPLAHQTSLGARIVTSAVFFAVGTGLVLQVHRTLLRELRQARKVAGAAQNALLRPLPPRVDGLAVGAARLSAERGSSVGGDLYEVIATEHGVRVVMGDVRGHGLDALGTAAAVLGSFREAVHDEPELARVLDRLDRALGRHLRGCPRVEQAESFVTVLLLEIGGDGAVRALNCGHPWPYRLRGTGVEPLSRSEPLPPLGPFPLPADLSAAHHGRLGPGEGLFLFTDGAEDARDGSGRFFPLAQVVTSALRDGAMSPQAVLSAVLTRLSRHTSGNPPDDVALLMLRDEREREHPAGARETARPATAHPGPTTHR